jgi:hypothetical protein
MHRRALRHCLCLTFAATVAACGGDSSSTATASAGESDSADTSAGSLTAGSLTSADTTAGGSMSASQGSESADTTATGTATASATDSAGTDSAGTDSAGTDSAGTDSAGTDSAGTDAGTTGDTGGPGDPPTDPPGVLGGLCEDPGLEQWCYSGAPTTYNVGICRPGVQECVQIDLDLGEWGPCEDEQLPEVEVCDGLDNDCDGEIDEDLGSTNCGEGICNHDEPNCVDGEPNECDPDAGGMMEVCNDLDDDCDGDIDDGLGDQVVECGLGACEHEVTACEDGDPPECDPLEGASEEVCDGIDNDCDGDTDEGIDDLQCGVGQCEHSLPACINGIPQVCDPFDGATNETCDAIDNDCDGLTDEDQGNWVCGMFDCQVSVPTCINGVEQGPETCVPLPGGDEICGDGIDNNCDNEAPACVETFLVGTDNAIRPIDIVWAVDSSGSMTSEMAVVETEINDFATTLAGSGSSTRLHLLADRGIESLEICVNPPLGGNNCTDNAPQFYQYDTNGGTNNAPFVHSNNALGRIMHHSPTWIPRLQVGSHVAFIVTTDDNGDDTSFTEDAVQLGANGGQHAECVAGDLIDNTSQNRCRWNDPNSANNYTSLANDVVVGYFGFKTFMTNLFPTFAPVDDWTFYSIIGGTGTATLTGADDAYEFSCDTRAANGVQYVDLSEFTGTQDSMTSICAADWDLSGLASDIVSNIPNDTYILDGSPAGQCLAINPATIVVLVNGVPMAAADWMYDAPSCTLTIVTNIPVVGDNVVIVYENF